MARILGATERRISREIIWTSLLPFFFTGLKIAVPRAVSATIVGEFLVSSEGVGHYIEHARQTADTTGVFAGIVVAIALVLAINAIVNFIERRALAWPAKCSQRPKIRLFGCKREHNSSPTDKLRLTLGQPDL